MESIVSHNSNWLTYSGSVLKVVNYNPLNLPPSNVSLCFHHCGEYTPTGRAEVEQIPSDWK